MLLAPTETPTETLLRGNLTPRKAISEKPPEEKPHLIRYLLTRKYTHPNNMNDTYIEYHNKQQILQSAAMINSNKPQKIIATSEKKNQPA